MISKGDGYLISLYRKGKSYLGAVQIVALDVQSQSVLKEPSFIMLVLTNCSWFDYSQINEAVIDTLLKVISFDA